MGSAELRTELENLLKSLKIDFVSVDHPEVINLTFVIKPSACTKRMFDLFLINVSLCDKYTEFCWLGIHFIFLKYMISS